MSAVTAAPRAVLPGSPRLLQKLLPTRRGGMGLGLPSVLAELEAHGQALGSASKISTAFLGALPLAETAAKQAEPLIEGILRGAVSATMAVSGVWEHPETLPICLHAQSKPWGYALDGSVPFVLEPASDFILAPAWGTASNKNLRLFLLPLRTRGLRIEEMMLEDRTRRFGRLLFLRARVPSSALLAGPGKAESLVRQAMDRALVALSADMLGGSQGAFDAALAYARERRVFGKAIGRHQAMSHLLVDLYAEIHLTRALLRGAAESIGRRGPAGRLAACMAKAAAGELYPRAVETAVHVHGARGFCRESGFHRHAHRALVSKALWGNPRAHQNVVAKSLLGKNVQEMIRHILGPGANI